MAVGSPDWSPKVISSGSADDQLKISVTASDSSGSFNQQVRALLIYNDGVNAVHYNRDATATTSKFKIPAKAWLMVDVPVTTPHFICATGETATVFCLGIY